MDRRRYKYMKKKIDALGISQSVQNKLMKKIKKYYRFYKKIGPKEKENDMIKELIKKFDFTEQEASYVNIVCRSMFMDDVIPIEKLSVQEPKEKEKPIVYFKNVNEWADYRAREARKFKDPELYKYIAYNFMNYKRKELEKKVESEFGVNLWNGFIGKVWNEYRKSVKRSLVR